MYLSIIFTLRKWRTILGYDLDLMHTFDFVTLKIKMTSVQPWPLLMTAVWELSPCFSPPSDTDLSVGPLALPSCWWVQDAYAEFRRAPIHLTFFAYLSSCVFAWQCGNSNFFFPVLLLGFRFHLSLSSMFPPSYFLKRIAEITGQGFLHFFFLMVLTFRLVFKHYHGPTPPQLILMRTREERCISFQV